MSVYVRNGTPVYGPPLCETCTHGHIVKGYRETEEIVRCNIDTPMIRVSFRVRECSSYLDKTREPLYELKRIAWTILPERGKKTAGFVPPSESSDVDDDIELIFNDKP
jgi:hypothetical protein